MEKRDIIIVGAGPAGLTAGLFASRARLDALILEKLIPGGQIMNTEEIEDYPGFPLIKGPELAAKFHDHALHFGVEIRTEEVLKIKDFGQYKIVESDENQYVAGAVIVTAGGAPKKLKVKGENEYAGKGVSYCAVCDGAFFKDEKIAVVGGGNAAVEEAMFLTKFGEEVNLIHRRDALRADKIVQDRAFANKKLKFIWDSVIEEICGDGTKVTHVHGKNVKTGESWKLEVTGVFIFVGFIPNSNLFDTLPKMEQGGYVITDYKMETSIPGIFAAGDIRFQLIRQITNSVGDGTTAAVAAEKYLESVDWFKNKGKL